MAYIKNYVLKEAVIKDAHKAEATKIYNYPYAAVEELLANASRIMYDIEISVSYDNRIFPKNLGFKWRKENTSWVKSYKDLNEWETDREYLNTKNVFYKLISQTENTCLTRFAKVETK